MAPAGALRSYKIAYLKRCAQEALAQGQNRDAWDKYGEAITLAEQAPKDASALRDLLCNRALAFLKGGRAQQALEDGASAAALAPSWPKAWWRQGRALAELGRWPEAAQAFLAAWRLAPPEEKAECGRHLQAAVQRLTRQQLADVILELLGRARGDSTGSHSGCRAQPASARTGAAGPTKRTPSDDDSGDGSGDGGGGGGGDDDGAAPACTTLVLPLSPGGAAAAAKGSATATGSSSSSSSSLALAGQLQLAAAGGSDLAVWEDAEWLEAQAAREAMFQIVQDAHGRALYSKAHPPGVYHAHCLRWLQQGCILPHEAALLTCRVALRLQSWAAAQAAAEEALAALRALANQDVQQLEGWLLDAYSLAADSYLAGTQDGSATASLQQAGGSSSAPAARPAGAARAALMALELLPVAGAEARQRELQGKLRAATEKLSSGQVHQLYQRVAQEAARGAGGGQARHKARSAFARQHMLAPVAPASASDGDTPAQAPQQPPTIHLLDITLTWPLHGSPAALPTARRVALLAALAAAAGVPLTAVSLEGMQVARPAVSKQACLKARLVLDAAASMDARCAQPCEAAALEADAAREASTRAGTSPMPVQGPPQPQQLHPPQGDAPAGGLAGALHVLGSPQMLAAAAAAAGADADVQQLLLRCEACVTVAGAGSAEVQAQRVEGATNLSADSSPSCSTAANAQGAGGKHHLQQLASSSVEPAQPEEGKLALTPTPPSASSADSEGVQLTAAAPPPPAPTGPYTYYSLVTAEGRPLERPDKHPFCMSRVLYAASERPSEEAWAQMADGTCRWRQSGGEVRIIAMRVPPDLPASRLAVTLQPYFVSVVDRVTGQVYLEGDLERGIAPADSVWTLGGGEGEDGCLLTLAKMNLELAASPWQHSESWWPCLFQHHPAEVAWDDYEKDYSDLPAHLLAGHALLAAKEEATKQLEAADQAPRKAQLEADGARKRHRQARLEELRGLAWSRQQQQQQQA